MNPLVTEQQRRNRESRNGWDLYAHHRDRVTSLLLDAAAYQPAGRLCVLGAGNCNDLDLQRLLVRFRQIELVDLDGDSLAVGCGQQGLGQDARIVLHPDVDLTGIYPGLSAFRTPAPSASEIDALAAAARSAGFPMIPSAGDVVASVGLLSQLVDSILTTVPDPQRALPLIQSVRHRHLVLLAQQTRPGGTGVLVTEVVSSDTAEDLPTVPEHALPDFLADQLARRNFFTGLHPGVILESFRTASDLAELVDGVRAAPPWKWQFLSRTYAVAALIFRRRNTPAMP